MAERDSNTATVRVYVVKLRDRPGFVLRYQNPCSRKWHQKAVRTKVRREAERSAARLEAELASGRYVAGPRVTWEEFRERYEDEVCPGLAPNTEALVATVFNWVERCLKPERLAELTADRLSYFHSELQRTGRSPATIRTYLAHLRAALKWASTVGMLSAVPTIRMPVRVKRNNAMKGRPITREEVERMLEAATIVVGSRAAPSWQFFLEGLWNSGLRLGEALELSWDPNAGFAVDLAGRFPMFSIRAESEKGNQDRLLAMAPEFAMQIETTPIADRRGRVFRLIGVKGEPVHDLRFISAQVSRMGRLANVVVNRGKDKVKYAAGHDLRRSFGERWAMRVLPQVLMELMRHESIETTQHYYVGRNANRTAAVIWESCDVSCDKGKKRRRGRVRKT